MIGVDDVLIYNRIGQCRGRKCTLTTPVSPGGSCTGSYECPGDLTCTNGICTDAGKACQADDGTVTGFATSCLSGEHYIVAPARMIRWLIILVNLGFCRTTSCASIPSRLVGESCLSDDVCIGAKSFYGLAPSCGNDPGLDPICGGGLTQCYGSDLASGNGPDAICASGTIHYRHPWHPLTRIAFDHRLLQRVPMSIVANGSSRKLQLGGVHE